jgi:hypothetical protein
MDVFKIKFKKQMSILKRVCKTSDKIDEVRSTTCVIVHVSTTMSNKGNPVSYLTLLLPDGETVKVNVGGHHYKVGPATVVETDWNGKSKYGAGISTKVTNVV